MTLLVPPDDCDPPESSRATWWRFGLLTVNSLVLYAAWFAYSARCDDTCDTPGTHSAWSRLADSWQWTAQLDVAMVGVILGLGALAATASSTGSSSRRRWLAGVLTLGAAASLLLWAGGMFVAPK